MKNRPLVVTVALGCYLLSLSMVEVLHKEAPATSTKDDNYSRLETELLDPESERRQNYLPYHLGKLDRRELGRERNQFEKWERLSFKDFLANPVYQTPEAVVAYFADHPTCNCKECFLDLFLDNTYEDFISKFFQNRTKLSAPQLAKAVDEIVGEVLVLRELLKRNTQRFNEVGERAISHHVHDFMNQLELEKILFIPSLEVYHHIVTGSSKQHNGTTDSSGSVSYPTVEQNTDAIQIIKRVAFVPMAFSVSVQDFSLKLTKDNKIQNYVTSSNWFTAALNSASHETEHARVFGSYSPWQAELRLGFKTLPVKGSQLKDVSTLQKEKALDEGMTDFISIWKRLVYNKHLSEQATFSEIIEAVKSNLIDMSSYPVEVEAVIADMIRYHQKYPSDSTLTTFLSSYYYSSSYPSTTDSDY